MDKKQKHLHLLYLSTARIPSEKAHAYQILKMCEAFTLQGADVTLLYQKRDNSAWTQDIHDVFAYYGVRVPFSMKQLFCMELPFLGEKMARLQFYAGIFFYLLAAACFIIARRQSIDVIYCRDKFSLILLGLLTTVVRIPFFYEAHDAPQALQRIQFFFLKRTAGVIVITGQLKKKFMQDGLPAHAIHVAHDAVDLRRFYAGTTRVPPVRDLLGIPRDALVIGYVGRFVTMEKEKGIRELIEAMQYFTDYPLPIYLAFVGGPMNAVPSYCDLIDQLRLNRERFKFNDLVPAAEVPAYVAAFDIAAMPFPWEPHYAFNMSPLKMFEYMAAGKPIVATELPAVMEVLHNGENAVLVEPDNPEALARGIKSIIEDKELAGRIGARARQDVTNFTWEKRAETILAFIGSAALPVR